VSHLLIVTRPSLVDGFHLAGVEAHGVEDAEAGQALISSWLDSGETGLLAVDADLHSRMSPGFLERLEAADRLPHIVIPGAGPAEGGISRRHRIAQMIRRAIGFQIALKGEETEAINHE
jgi:vacuolar-type H+-ATPase subunit F/Vma7